MNNEDIKEMIRKSNKLDREMLENRDKQIRELSQQNEKLASALFIRYWIIAILFIIIVVMAVSR